MTGVLSVATGVVGESVSSTTGPWVVNGDQSTPVGLSRLTRGRGAGPPVVTPDRDVAPDW